MSRSVRVTIVRPSLPAYRIPVYAALARRTRLDLRVVHSELEGTPNAEPVGFDAEPTRMRSVTIGTRMVYWLDGQPRQALSKNNDVLVLEWNLNNVSLVPTLIRAKVRGIRTILWGHGYSVQDSRAKSRLRVLVGRQASAVLLYDETTAESYRSRFHYPKHKVFVAQNALDQRPIALAQEHWASRPDELLRFQMEQDLHNRPVVLHVSRLGNRRQLDVLIQAMPHVLRAHPRAVAVIVGDGSDRARLRTLAQELGISAAVRFVDGDYDEENLARWFLSSSIFCSPGHLGLSVLHAFGYRLPVVAGDDMSRHPPDAMALQHGENGLTFRSAQPLALAAALDSLISDENLATTLGEAGYEAVQSNYTLEAMVDGFESAIVAPGR